jgi:hypothetical protein
VPDVHRDAFGRLTASPASLSLRQRVDCLRRLSGELQAAGSVEARWLGGALSDWLQRGGDLEAVLGVKPQRGSHARPEALVAQAETARLLLRLAAMVGSDTHAARIMSGAAPVPAGAVDLVAELRARRAPTSRRAFVRARAATRAGR